MKKKSFLLTILGALSALAFVAGCGTSDPAHNAHLIPDRFHSQAKEENDPDMLIDGKLDESIYTDIEWLDFSYASNVDGTRPQIRLTGFTTEYGVYIASKAYDTNVRYGGGFMEQISPAVTTGWEFSIVVDKKGEKPS